MKSKLIYLTALMFFSKLMMAQLPSSAYYVFMYDNYGHELKFGDKVQYAQVKSYDITYNNEEGKVKRRFAYHLNNAGNIVYQAKFNKSGKLIRSYYNTYINDTAFESRIVLNKKGDTVSKSSYQFEKGELVRSYTSTGKQTWEYLYTYDMNGNRTSYTFKRNNIIRLTIRYEYDNSNKLIKQSTYNKNNKLTSVINYECNYQGETQKKVDQSKVCVRRDVLPNGGYVVYNDYTKPNGKLIRNVLTYNSDSNLVQVQSYNSKNRLVSTSKYSYDSNGNCTLHEFTNKNVNFVSTYQYNSKNLLEAYTNRKRQQVYNLVKYSYVYR